MQTFDFLIHQNKRFDKTAPEKARDFFLKKKALQLKFL
jgi:hypothetical protein